jgi:hypothetical protein
VSGLLLNDLSIRKIMDPLRILFVLRLPARLTVLEVSVLLNFHVDAIRYLVKIGLLEAIGQIEDVELMFDAAYIDGLRRNTKWIAKATNAVRSHVHERNEAQKARKQLKTKEKKV